MVTLEFREQLSSLLEGWGNQGLPIQEEILSYFPSSDEVRIFDESDEVAYSFKIHPAFQLFELGEVESLLTSNKHPFAKHEHENSTFLVFSSGSQTYKMTFESGKCEFKKVSSSKLSSRVWCCMDKEQRVICAGRTSGSNAEMPRTRDEFVRVLKPYPTFEHDR